MDILIETWQPYLKGGAIAAGAIVAALVLHAILFRGLGRLSRRLPRLLLFDGVLLGNLRRPMLLILPVLALYAVRPWLRTEWPEPVIEVGNEVLYLLLLLGIAWMLIGLVRVMENEIVRRFDIGLEDNLRARKVHTQARILKRILVVAIFVVTVAGGLLRYEEFRELGTGLLASAGILSIIVGLAAQRTIGNLLAGFQIAITQPIRVDDVVIVEDEWGWIEEITLTYVVVRIWDLRRLVLPISYFIEQPFENWTRTSANLLGTVFLYTDYTVPFDAVREELERLAEASDYWDGKVCRLHVTNVTERTVELRGLVSASSAPRAFELRTELREKLVAFLQREYPGSLPTERTRWMGGPTDAFPVDRQQLEGPTEEPSGEPETDRVHQPAGEGQGDAGGGGPEGSDGPPSGHAQGR